MNLPLSPGDLARPEWDRFQAALEEFEYAWNGSATVDLARFLPPREDRLRLIYLSELIKTELEILWRRGERPLVENYLERFPDLREHPAELPKLLVEEYRARHSAGTAPPLAHYQERFPEHYAEFCRLVGAPSSAVMGFGTLKPGSRKRASSRPPSPPPPRRRKPPRTAPAPSGRAWSDGPLPVGGGYKLVRRIGAGQFGEVWLAEAPGGVEVAMKIIRRGLDQAEAKRELEALEHTKRLRRTFLLQLQAYWALEDRLVIAMELADGSLTDELKRHGGRGMPAENLLRYMEEAAEVLDFLHEQRVVHRDVKPDNILLLRGHVKLADLGMARLMMERSFTGTSCGSPAYMAPEVWQGRAGRHSDQYSLAASYVQLRLNRSLFPGADIYGIMMAHVREVPDLSELPATEREVVLKALAKEPEQRFANCSAFVLALRGAVPQTATVRRPPVPSRPRRRWALWGAVLASLLVVALATAAAVWRSIVPRDTRTESPRESAPGYDSTGRATSREEPPPSDPWLPAGFERGNGPMREQVEGKPYYSHIVFKGLDGVPRSQATFVLIKPPAGGEVKAPFYIMQHKVSNRLFRAVLVVKKDKLPDGWPKSAWDKGAKPVDGKGDLPIKGPTPQGGDCADFPVFRVRADDAEHFARLMGGRLPTAEEWGVAAGFSPRPLEGGPFQGTLEWEVGDFALRKEGKPPQGGAMPVGAARRDRRRVETLGENCVKECYDMASNGFEWTATTVDGANNVTGRVPFEDNQKEVLIKLMGTSYTNDQPLTNEEMANPTKAPRLGTLNEMRKADISFRVVVDIDSPR